MVNYRKMPALVDKSKFLIIRLARWGCTNRPFYHIVVTKNRYPRNAKPIEQIGTFDPMKNKHGELLCSVNYQRLIYYLSKNTRLSKSAAQLLGYSGFIPVHPTSYIQAKRNNAAQKEKEQNELTSEDGAELESEQQVEVQSETQSEAQIESLSETPNDSQKESQIESQSVSQDELQSKSYDEAKNEVENELLSKTVSDLQQKAKSETHDRFRNKKKDNASKSV